MKKVILIISTLLLFFSCKKDADMQLDDQVTACFEISNTILNIGEELQITNCSSGASSYEFNFGNGITSTEETPSISYESSGQYNISLKAISEGGTINVVYKSVSVSVIESSYLFSPTIFESESTFPINFGKINNSFYFIENYENDVYADTPSKYNYVELDVDNNSFSKKYLADHNYNSNAAFLSELGNNDKLVYTIRSLSNQIRSTKIQVSENWEPIEITDQTLQILYGTLEDNGNHLYYGSYRSDDPSDPYFSSYKSPTINVSNNLGELIERKSYRDYIQEGFIGDLIKTNSGFMAFGGITDPITFGSFDNYRPLIIVLDNNYDYVSHTDYENTSIYVSGNNFLNGSFHIDKLSNGNFVTYSHNEFRIVDQFGVEIMHESLPSQARIQGLVSLESEGFILSRQNYLDKYDANGNLVKTLRINGRITPNLILEGNEIYFASGYYYDYTSETGTTTIIKNFIGAVDTDLNVINLN